ncbi:jg24040, partial [Pararge aegeria aegeria]
ERVHHATPRDHEPDRHLPHPGAASSKPLVTLLRNVLRYGRGKTKLETNIRWRIDERCKKTI